MHCEGKLKLRSHIASYCLIEVATKAGLTVLLNLCNTCICYFVIYQDSHELFHVLTQTLDEDTARYPRVVSLFDTVTLQVRISEYLMLRKKEE
jgi:hypothetical protein